MKCGRVAILGALAFLPAFAQVSNVSFAPDPTDKPLNRQFGRIRDLTDHGNGTSTSTNWSGYAVLGSSFTWATGSWVVPTANCSGVRGSQYSSFWVGLDGYTSSTVEQTGTDSDCSGSTPVYYAWYEFYPKASFEITTVPVKPGDVMYAVVYYDASSTIFYTEIVNETTGKSAIKGSYVSGAVRSSAEWIVEAPCCTGSGGILPLSNFGTANLGKDTTNVMYTNWAKDTSATTAIGGFPAVNTILIDKTASSTSPQLSNCSLLSTDGSSFSCTWAP